MLLREFVHTAFDLELALMENGNAIADRFDLTQFVGREEDSFAFVLEPLNDSL